MNPESIITFLRWAAPISFGLHIIEELFWPGGFREWYHGYRPNVAGEPMSYYYKANAVYFSAVLSVPLLGSWAGGYHGLLFTAGMLFNNLIFTHVRGAFKTRQYSPGIVTGLALYVPLFVASYGYLLSHHLVSIREALACLLLSFSGEIYFALKKVKPSYAELSDGLSSR